MAQFVELVRENPILAVIAAGEVAFWVFLLGGLAARYLLRLRRTSSALLVSVPLIDVVVLAATFLDLRGGGEASFAHGLAAVYLGFSVAFGPQWVRWADERFAHRFAGAPPPTKPPQQGTTARRRDEWRIYARFLVAWAISAGIVGLFVLVFGDNAETMATWPLRLTVVGAVWLVVGPLWSTFATAKEAADA